MSKEDAYAYAKEVYAKNHAANQKTAAKVPNAKGMTKEQWKKAYRDARLQRNYDNCMEELNRINVNPEYGDANYTKFRPYVTWVLTPIGDGAHLIERANIRRRTQDLGQYDKKDTPRYYPYGDIFNAGRAHVRLHEATSGNGIKRSGGNPSLTTQDLLQKYEIAYSDKSLEFIRGELRTPDGKIFLGNALTPAEAFNRLKSWGGN